MHKKYLKAFTLVELIIVITILAILATIAFVSFSNYTKSARDANRIATLTNIEKGLQTFQISSGKYPIPSESKTVSLSGEILSYMGTIGESVSKLIKTSNTPVDPNSGETYVYATNANQRSYQLLGYLENQTTQNILNSQTYAYKTNFFPKTLGEGVGIMNTINNELIQEDVDLFTTHSGTMFQLLIPGSSPRIEIGHQLRGLQMFAQKGGNFLPPSSCPEGFIPVPGNPDFMQPGFCVAKYEMSYEDAIIPNTCHGDGCPLVDDNISGQTEWNTVRFQGGKKIVSKRGLFPIASVSQFEAIQACESIGAHLITNNEWMTIARNIEVNSENWSSGITGSGYVSNGVSNNWLFGCGTTNTKFQYPMLPRFWGAKTGGGNGNDVCDKKRQLILNNGEKIWDIAGNLWEHVNKANTIDGFGFSTKLNRELPYLDFFSSNESGWHPTGWVDVPVEIKNLYGPLGDTYGHVLNGIGNIRLSYQNSDNVFLRGGDGWGTNSTGIYSLHLNWGGTFRTRHVGFRCAY